MRWGCVVLTRGDRPEVLDLAVRSLLRQRGVDVDVAVVGNGWRPSGLPDGVRGVHVERDEGIPAGRNAGVPAVEGELLFFLDDDAELVDDDALARLERRFDGRVGLVQLRVEPRGGGRRSSDWSPRLGAGAPERSGEVTAVWEGAVAMPRAVFERAGGWPAEFRFVHEGVDLAWRVMDLGLRVEYAGDLTVLHPSPPLEPTRHAYSTYYGARNRVWLARRYLPLPLGALYAATFLARAWPRLGSARERHALLRGYRDGLRTPCGPRRRLRAGTLWRMTRAGRPPVI
ncbi:MAG TPA: glycosyltransferase [Solirubrobacteraceae bacterium]|jgi:GT2 family glycosyltransferase|nr:glycosyltransferase [Solirubrobacteraceae bacterium]